MTNSGKIKIGISSCLLGQEVRFNGGHKLSKTCKNDLARYFEYTAVCPEVGIGLGIPRKPIRLVGNPEEPRAVGVGNSELDVTEALQEYASDILPELTEICGYVFIKGSPSCGLFRVKVYQEDGYPDQSSGRGIYAKMITDANPMLPVEEAGRLQDPVLKENFIARVYAYSNWRELLNSKLTLNAIVQFHTRYKYLLMAHHAPSYSSLGRMLSKAGDFTPEELADQYFPLLMQALANKATRKTHTNVLMHLQGYLKKYLDKNEKVKLSEAIDQYRLGILPLIGPVLLLKNHFTRYPNEYIDKQYYLQPYPDDLSLRNLI